MDQNITYPTVNIITGTTPTLVAMEMMELLAHHNAIDRHKVAFVFLDTQMSNVELVEHIAKYKRLFHITALSVTVPPGVSNHTRIPQDGDPSEPHTFIGSWIPYSSAAGAGGVRNNGHVALSVVADVVKNAIIQAMIYVQQRLDGDSGPPLADVYVNIVTFLGGGTGSGTVNDLAALVQEIGSTDPRYRVRVQVHALLPAAGDKSGFAAELKMANCTAAMLELLALSMAPGAQTGGRYTKWLRGMQLRLTINQNVASGVYLYGQGRFGSTVDMARALGLTLYLLATNKSGVGQALAAAYINHVNSITTDDRGLPSLFGSCCAVAVRVPVRELSRAFAYKMSERLLNKIINGEYEATVPEGERRTPEEWDLKRCQLVDPSQSSEMQEGVYSFVPKAPRFDPGEFRNADEDTIRELKEKAERQRKDCKARTQADWSQWMRHEQRVIEGLLNAQIPARHKILRVEGKMREYEEVRRYFSHLYPEAGPPFPDDAGQEVVRTARRNVNAHEDACEDAARAYNNWQDNSARSDRGAILVKELYALEARYRPQVSQLKFVDIPVDVEQVRLRELLARCPGHEGRLERPHLFQSSLFDALRLNGDRVRLIDTYLFEAATKELHDWRGRSLGDEDAERAQVERCIRKVGTPPDQQAASGFVDKIVDYFASEYLEAFDNLNVFDILRVVRPTGPGRTYEDQQREIEQILTDHLVERLELVEPRYEFVPSQSPANRLGAGLYVGVQARREDDRQMFGDIVGRVTLLNTALPQPTINHDNLNPHVIEVSLDQYGITMSTMPDFNYPINTMMYQFLNMVDGRRRGGNPIPEYTSAAMERLIEDPNALPFYVDGSGVTQQRKLYDRVIR